MPSAQIDERENHVMVNFDAPLSKVLQEVERLYLASAMTKTGGNRTKAARIAGVSRETFNKKLGHYKVKAKYELV